MVPHLRSAFNAAFREHGYDQILREFEADLGGPLGIRVCETPLFIDADLTRELMRAATEVVAVVTSPAYLQQTEHALPDGLIVPANDRGPAFLSIDFALAHDEFGQVVPRLIEVQGFPSMYGLMWLLDKKFRATYPVAWDGFTPYFAGLTEDSYRSLLYDHIVGDCDPENVIMLDVEPEKQKTSIDFVATKSLLGIETVCATKIQVRHGRPFYRSGSREVPIHRICNRVVADDLVRRRADIAHLFFAGDLEVDWIGHPSWFVRISKLSLPFIRSSYCSPAQFVNELTELPEDLDNYVLKPLLSLAGRGVEIAPTAQRLRGLDDPSQFVLQRRVAYAPVVDTPHGLTKAEVRMMYLSNSQHNGEPLLVNNFVRMSRGDMIGVDFNKDSAWCGATLAYHPPVG